MPYQNVNREGIDLLVATDVARHLALHPLVNNALAKITRTEGLAISRGSTGMSGSQGRFDCRFREQLHRTRYRRERDEHRHK